MWWIIIGAAIAMVVMIVLLVFFTGSSGDLQRGILDCKGKGGKCIDPITGNCDGTKTTAFKCGPNSELKGGTCCIGS